VKAGGCTLEEIIDVTSFHTDPAEQIGMAMAMKGAMFPARRIRTGRLSGSTDSPASISRSR